MAVGADGEKVSELVEQSKYLLHAAAAEKVKMELTEKKEAREKEVKAMSICYRPFAMVHDKILTILEDSSGLDPKVRERLNPSGVRFISLMAKCCFAAVLIAFTYTGYASDQANKYISLDSSSAETGDKTSNYRKCLTVPYAINAIFSVDTNGIWSGASAYIPGKSKLKFILNSFEKSADGYSTFMSDVKSNIKIYVAAGATTRNAMLNLAYFMSWTYAKTDTTTSGATVTDYISFKGDPAYVFDRFAKTAVLGAADQQCYAIPSINYDRASAHMEIEYDYGVPTVVGSGAQYTQAGSGYFGSNQGSEGIGCCPEYAESYSVDNSKCLLPPGDYGYDRGVDKSYFRLRYNMWSLTTAFAVNQGIVPYGTLNVVQTDLTKSAAGCYGLNSNCDTSGCSTSGSYGTNSPYTLTYDSSASSCSIKVGATKYFIEARMDSRYPGMSPIYCLVTELNSNSAKMCFVRIGKTFVLPYMNHMGTSANSGDFYNFQSWCSCSNIDFSTIPSTTTSKTYTSVAITIVGSVRTITMASMADASQIRKGYSVSGTGIPSGTTVTAVNAVTKAVELSSSFAAGTYTVTFTTSIKDFYTSNSNVGLTGTHLPTSGKFFSGSTYLGSTNSYCNMFDLTHGLVVIKGDIIDTVLGQFVETLSSYTKEQVNAMATLSGWTSLKVGGNAGAQIPRTMKLYIVGPTACTASTTGFDEGCDIPWGTTASTGKTFDVEGKLTDVSIIASGGMIGNYVYYNGYSLLGLPQGSTPFYFPDNVVVTAVTRSATGSGACVLTTAVTGCVRYTITISDTPTMDFLIDGQANGGQMFLNTFAVGKTQATDVYKATGIAYGSSSSAIVNAFSWCSPTSTSQGGASTCAVLAVNTVDTIDQRINEEGGVSVSSSCADDFTMADTVWLSADGTAGIQKVPPTSLFNDYYEVSCLPALCQPALLSSLTSYPSPISNLPASSRLLLLSFLLLSATTLSPRALSSPSAQALAQPAPSPQSSS